MNSMTGYGKASVEREGRKITVELRSVNHRFLDTSVKLPKILNYLEDGIRKSLSENFKRGHFDVYLSYENKRIDGIQLSLNEGVANEYFRLKNLMVEKYGVADDFSVSAMLKIPDAVIATTAEENEDEISLLCLESLTEAISQMKKMRAFEGEKLKSDILNKVDVIDEIVSNIKLSAPNTVENYRAKLTERIKEALAGVAVDEAKLLNEVAFFADKVGIDEELTRLKTHCLHLRELLESDNSVGKNLDFLIQEFNREANTIGSKCNDIEITNLVLKLKNEIEKIREQVQNVE